MRIYQEKYVFRYLTKTRHRPRRNHDVSSGHCFFGFNGSAWSLVIKYREFTRITGHNELQDYEVGIWFFKKMKEACPELQHVDVFDACTFNIFSIEQVKQ